MTYRDTKESRILSGYTGFLEDPVPQVPPAKLNYPESRMPPGWNDDTVEWKLPDYAYSQERREEMLKKFEMCLKFEKESNFMEESSMFISDYPEIFEKKKNSAEKQEEEENKNMVKEEEMIKLTRPIDYDDLDYVIEHYDYDSEDDEVNKLIDVQAENFIRSKVVEYRKSIGKQI